MTNFELTFGKGKDKVVVEIAGTSLINVLQELESKGLHVEEITKTVKLN